MTLLLLRGPPDTRRAEVSRRPAACLADLGAVEDALRELSRGDEPLVRELARQPGQKENRWANLAGEGVEAPPASISGAHPPTGSGRGSRPREALEARVERLERLVAELAREVRGDAS